MAFIIVRDCIRKRDALEARDGAGSHRSYAEYVYDDAKPNPDGSFDLISAAFVSEGLPDDTEHVVHFGRKKDRVDIAAFTVKGNGRHAMPIAGLRWALRTYRNGVKKWDVVMANGRGVVTNAAYPRVKALNIGRQL